MAFKENLQASVTELVCCEPLRMPNELLTLTADPVDSAHFITELDQHTARLRSIPAAHHASPATFVLSDLEKCTHVFLHQNKTRRALQPTYSGPYEVLSRRKKTLQLLVCGRPVTMSTNRVMPIDILNGTDCGNNTFKPPVEATLAVAPQNIIINSD
jgi:hypothetical protein